MSARAYQKPGRPPCSVEGCSKSLYCGGMCTMHYQRSRNGGDVDQPSRVKQPDGAGHVTQYGYRWLHAKGHPLATSQGKISEHRMVLYGVIGPGAHSCHWCGRQLQWGAAIPDRLVVDHLDANRLNNSPSNLVPSCWDCNAKRGKKP